MVKEEYINFVNDKKFLIIIILLALVLVVLLKPYLFLLMILTVVNAVLVNIRTKSGIPVDFTPTIFCAGISAVVAGWPGLLFFVIVGVILPTVVTGMISPEAMIFWITLLALGYLAIILRDYFQASIILIGIIISFGKFLISFLNGRVFSSPIFMFLLDDVLNLAINIMLFIRLGPILVG